MAVYSIKKVLSLPAEASANTVYYVKGEADSRVKLYVTDTAGTLFPVGILDGTDVLNTLLAGYSAGTDTALSSSDSILQAFQKVQGQLNAISTSVSQGMKVPLPLDCSTEPNYPAADAGDSYKVTVAGKIGGASGILVQVGDLITAITDNGGGTEAAVGSQWFILQANTDNATESVTGLTRIATDAEVIAGSESFAYVTPLRLKGRLDLKQNTITGAATTITSSNLTINRALISNASGKVAVSTVTSTELGYVSGVTSSIQTQLNSKATTASLADYVLKTTALTINGITQDLSINRTWEIDTDIVNEGLVNLYFTEDRVQDSILSDYVIGTNVALANTDSVIGAFGKLQAQINNAVSSGITGSGVAGQVSYWDGTNSQIGSTKLTFTAGIGDVLTLGDSIAVTPVTGRSEFLISGSTGAFSHFYAGGIARGLIYSLNDNFNIRASEATGVINLQTGGNNTRWSVLANGILQSTGSQTISTSSGLLNLSPSNGAVNITGALNSWLDVISNSILKVRLGDTGGTDDGLIQLFDSTGTEKIRLRAGAASYINSDFNLSIGSATDTGNKLYVNGTARIETMANAVGNFVTRSATGVLQQRTAAEVRSDLEVPTLLNTYSTVFQNANFSPSTSVNLDTLANATIYAGSGATNKFGGTNGQVASFLGQVSSASYGFQLQMQAGTLNKFGVRRIDNSVADAWREIITDSGNQTITGVKTLNTGTYTTLVLDRLSTSGTAIGFNSNGVTSGYIGMTPTNFGITNSVTSFDSAPFRVELATGNLTATNIFSTGVTRVSGSAPSLQLFENDTVDQNWMFVASGGNLTIRSANNDFSTNSVKLTIANAGHVTLSTIPQAIVDTDRFLVSDGGIIKYRTGSELLSDIGGQVARTLVSAGGTIEITNGDGVAGNPNLEMQWKELGW